MSAWLLLLSSCVEFSPFETDLPESEREQTSKNLERLQAMPAASAVFRFAAISDSHQEYDALSDVVERLNARADLAFVLLTGDMTAIGLRREYRLTIEQLQKLEMPVLTAIGNHDAISNGKELYRSMFGPYDYAFQYGGLRFVALNANTLEFGSSVPDLAWLDDVTRPAADSLGVVVFSHQPSRAPPYADVLVENAALALITGHAHRFAIGQDRTLLTVSVDDAQARRWSVFTVEGTKLSVEECSMTRCVPREP